MTKVAFLFLTIDNINHPKMWENYFKDNRDKINIYCHPKNPENVTIPWLKSNIINNLVDTKWGFIVNAYINLLYTALADKDNSKFITISESCIPLIPFHVLYDYIMKDEKKSFIKFSKISNYDLEARIKVQKGYEKYKFYKHYARFCLSRHHTKILLSKKNDLTFFYNMHVGDEFFLSLLNPFNNIEDLAITYDNWSYVNKMYNKNIKKIQALYLELESTNSKNKENIKSEIKNLQKEKLLIGNNPKSYEVVNLKDIFEAYDTNSFFWRKFPKTSNIYKFKYQFDYMHLNKELYFIHIPKTAGTTISHIFYENLNINIGYSYYRYINKHIEHNKNKILNIKYHNDKLIKRISSWHIPFSFFNKNYQNKIMSQYKMFAIVRDPYSRIISTYTFWIKYYKEKNNKNFLPECYLEIFDSFEINKINLNKFIHKVLGNPKYKYTLDGHLIPMYYYTHLFENNHFYLISKILKYENINEEFNNYIKYNKINLPNNIILSIHKNISEYTFIKEDLDEKSIKLIQQFYKSDFELFGYKY